MRSTTIALPLLAGAAAVSAQALNVTYATGLLAALNNAGFTSLAALATSVGSSSAGASFLATVAKGQNTLLAPSNAALANANSTLASNPSLIPALLSYHLLSGQINAQNFANYPNHTVARSYLNDSTYVNLPGGQAQSVVLSHVNNTDQILGGQPTITVSNTTQYESLTIHSIDQVLSIPSDLNTVLTKLGLSTLSSTLSSLGLLTPLSQAHGLTIFAPSNEALQAANVSQITNMTTLMTILENHIINGTAAYSTILGQGQYTSAAGQTFNFFTNTSGSYMQSGSSVAEFINSDQLYNAGVVHVIDTVLVNTQENDQAAQSAYNSYTSVAATAAPQGSPTSTGAPGTTSSASSNGASSPLSMHGFELTTLVAGVLVGAALLA